MIRVGIVGLGVIGTEIAKAIANGIAGVALAGVSVRRATTTGAYPVVPLDELIRRSDLVVEAATQAALRGFGPDVLAAGRDLMVLSVGALVGALDEWARDPEGAAERCQCPDSPHYRMMGNAVTVNVISWIGRRLMEALA